MVGTCTVEEIALSQENARSLGLKLKNVMSVKVCKKFVIYDAIACRPSLYCPLDPPVVYFNYRRLLLCRMLVLAQNRPILFLYMFLCFHANIVLLKLKHII